MLKRMMCRGWRVLAVAGSGTVLATTCSSTEIRQAVLAGVEVAADQLLNRADEDDDVSFGDWLSDELND